jgi:hypothetical protein
MPFILMLLQLTSFCQPEIAYKTISGKSSTAKDAADHL